MIILKNKAVKLSRGTVYYVHDRDFIVFIIRKKFELFYLIIDKKFILVLSFFFFNINKK